MKTKQQKQKEYSYGKAALKLYEEVSNILSHDIYDLEIFNLSLKLKKELETFFRHHM